MKVVVSGASGLIGTALTQRLTDGGHVVVSLVRRAARSASESPWDPGRGVVDHEVFADANAVVNLSGASIGDRRLTASYAGVVRSSRTDATHTLTTAMAQAGFGGVLVQGSAMGFYGDKGDDSFDETAESGSTLLADIVRDWERSARPALDAGIRTVFCRTGLVLADHGGFAARLLPLIKLGLLRSLGDGRTYHSWITLADQVAAIEHLITSDVSGPVNVITPTPVRDAELIAALANEAGRPRLFPVPAFVLTTAIGPAADDLLSSQNGRPAVLTGSGFQWRYPTVKTAAAMVMGND